MVGTPAFALRASAGLAHPTPRLCPLLPASQAVHIDGEGLERCGIELVCPRRHHAVLAVGDHLDYGSFIGAVEPDAVDQIWGADLGISLGGVAVAGGAIVGEQLLAGGK